MKMKTRSVGAASHRPQREHRKALPGLMLCGALLLALGAAGCGQKRPLQLPAKPGHARPANTNPPTEPDISRAGAEPAAMPASAAVMPQR